MQSNLKDMLYFTHDKCSVEINDECSELKGKNSEWAQIRSQISRSEKALGKKPHLHWPCMHSEAQEWSYPCHLTQR